MTAPTLPRDTVRAMLARAGDVLRRIVGAPDYERYLAHHRSHHPECAPMSRERFIDSRLADRYNRPGSRCC
jgi:uncharacterized short protein YbdD (DUF466 family)